MVIKGNFWGESVRAQVGLRYSGKFAQERFKRSKERKKNKFGYENGGLKYEIGLSTI